MQLLPLPPDVRQYLHARGLDDEAIARFRLGYTERNHRGWIVIPVRKADGGEFFKLRAAPGNTATNRYAYEPSGSSAELYGRGVLAVAGIKKVVLCEGEFDAMLLISRDIPAVTSTSGVGTFREEWCDAFPKGCHVCICFDNDEPGENGRTKVGTLLRARRPDLHLTHVRFPRDLAKGFDITDYFSGGGTVDGFWALETEEESVDGEVPQAEPGVPGEGAADAELRAVQTEERREGGSGPGEAGTGAAEPHGQGTDGSAQNPGPRIVLAGKERTFAKVPIPSKELSLAGWKKEIEARFPDLSFAAEACASVIAQLLIHDVHNPFALILIDAPSTGKTICLDFFSDLPHITYATDNFTPAAFVSNIAARSEEQLASIDLLPRIRHQCLLVREMGVMLSESEDELRQRIGQLTRVLDGDGYITESGVYGQRGYRGEYTFMFLGASTPFPLRVWKLMSGKGHRLFFLSVGTKEKTVEDLIAQISGTPFKVKQKACQRATQDFLYGVWRRFPKGVQWEYEKDEKEVLIWIAQFSLVLRRLRGGIRVWTEDGSDGSKVTGSLPEIEDPSRITTCLTNLARGHAVLCGRSSIDRTDLPIVVRVALDTCEENRRRLMRFLLNNNGQASVAEIQAALRCSQHTAEKECHKFIQLGLVDGEIESGWEETEPGFTIKTPGRPKNVIVLKDEFQWLSTNEEMIGLLEAVSVIK